MSEGGSWNRDPVLLLFGVLVRVLQVRLAEIVALLVGLGRKNFGNPL